MVIPLTAWLERLLGLRRLLTLSTILFVLFSMVCGLAVSLQTMIFGRIGQGLAGGVLIPMAVTIIAKRLPPSQQSIGLAMVAVTALFGPTTGPLLGGWLTETFSWRYIFFLNLPVCTLQVILLFIAFRKSEGDWSELRNADWLGIAGLVIGLGSLTTMLEEGHREQWFESDLIWKLTFATILGFCLIAWGQLRHPRPVIRLSLLGNSSLASSIAVMLVLGVMLFTGMFVTPQFLSAIAGYNALQAGEVVFLAGLSSFPLAFIYPFLVTRIDTRWIPAMGIPTLALGNLVLIHLTAQSVGNSFYLSQVLYGMGSTFCAMPIQQVAIASVSVDDATEANSLLVVSRNLGGSIGLAGIASFQEQRFELHRWQLHSALSANDGQVQHQMAETAGMFGGGPQGWEAAYHMMDGQVSLQALVMMFNDLFLVMGVAGMLALPAVMFLRPLDRSGAPMPVMH